MKAGQEYLDDWRVPHPDSVGTVEYRAIYECLEDLLTGYEENVAAKPLDFALSILTEFTEYASNVKNVLEKRKWEIS
jgi:hypothetical protein